MRVSYIWYLLPDTDTNTVGTTLVGVGHTANSHDTLRDLQIQTDIKHNINNTQDKLLKSGNNLYTYIRTV
jgi:hypothetical protein